VKEPSRRTNKSITSGREEEHLIKKHEPSFWFNMVENKPVEKRVAPQPSLERRR